MMPQTRRWILASFVLCALIVVSALSAAAAVDNKGTEFMLTFPGNNGSATLTLFIASDTAATVTVEIPGLSPPYSTTFGVTSGAVTSLSLPSAAELIGTNVVTTQGIRVSATAEIAVYGISHQTATTDGFLGLPVDMLGTDYIVVGRKQSVGPSQFGIVAVEDGTTVTITPTITTGTLAAGVPHNISLNRFQTYQLRSDTANEDLTGTIVTSTKPVAVFGGSQCAQVPEGFSFCDYLVEQLPSTDIWGKNFRTVSLAKRTSGDRVRVLAQTNGTEVRIDGVLVATLNRGGFHEADLASGSTHTIDATQPVLVMQYAKGSGTESNSSIGDPFMMMIVPNDQFASSYTVPTTLALQGTTEYFINVVVPTSAISSCTIDGVAFETKLVTGTSFSPIGTSSFSGGRLQVADGSHTLTCGGPKFAAYVYAFGTNDSYGYPGGLALTTKQPANQAPVAINDSFTVAEDTTLSGNVLTNDTDADAGTTLTAILVTGPSHHQGAFTLNSNGSFTYTPAANFHGTDSFTYKANDGTADSNVATVTITVTPIADATTTTLTSSPNPSSAGQLVTFTATVTSGAGTPTGTVTFRRAAGEFQETLGTGILVEGQATFSTSSLSIGTHSITAKYEANAEFTESFSAVLLQTVNNTPPAFDAIADVSVNENAAAQAVSITGVTAFTGPGAGSVEEGQTVSFSTASSVPTLIPAPTVTGSGSTRTLTFQPQPNANGSAVITVIANDGQATNNLFSRTFTITVNAVNNPPYFDPLDPPTFDLNASTTPVQTQLLITGISPGPPDEAGQTVTLSATSSNTAVVPNPTISGSGPTRTLTFQTGATAGAANVTITANDGQAQNNLFTRAFTVTVSGALSGDPGITIANVLEPTNPAGFGPGETVDIEVAVTFPTRDYTGDGKPDCYFAVPPDNLLVPRVNNKDADNIPEFGGVVFSEAALVKVCGEPVTRKAKVRLTDWYEKELKNTGNHSFTVAYIQLSEDPDQPQCNTNAPGSDCFSPVLKDIIEASGTLTVGSTCTGAFGTGAGGTGCAFAVKEMVTLHTVPLGGSPTKTPRGAVQVRVFDKNNAELQALVTAAGGNAQNPEGTHHAMIFERNVGRVGACITTAAGFCYAGVAQTGHYLVIAKFVDADNGQRVYAGRNVAPSQFVNSIAEVDAQIVKVINKQGKVNYGGGSKSVVTGSILEMILPDSAMWEGTRFVYPFIFTSDSTWNVDVCAQVPQGYTVVGAYDDAGNLVPSTSCMQSVVANQTKVIAFEVVDLESPEPSLEATLTITKPDGKKEVQKIKTSDIRRHTFDDQERDAKAKKSNGSHKH